MTTLGTLRSTIADDLARGDLTSQIAAAITQAISFYQEERLFWMETRDNPFDTSAGQSAYTEGDDSDIALWLKVDDVMLEDTGGIVYGPLCRIEQRVMERLLDQSAANGRPDSWSWYNGTFYLHPVPDATYTIRPLGQILVAGPSSDSEPNNPWMTRGAELLRCRAKAYLFVHTVKDPDQAGAMLMAADVELARLRRDTSKRTATGRIAPTYF